MSAPSAPNVESETLREAIREQYRAVASEPGRGYHFHTGRPLTAILGYEEEWLAGIPEASIESFAGTGNPFSHALPEAGGRIVDVGCGAGIDSLIAARLAGPDSKVVGIDMTTEMLDKAVAAAEEAGLANVEFRRGYGEELPVADDWADLLISNGVLNLMPDKERALAEMHRVLKPGGRLQIGDILVTKPVPQGAKDKIDLWTG